MVFNPQNFQPSILLESPYSGCPIKDHISDIYNRYLGQISSSELKLKIYEDILNGIFTQSYINRYNIKIIDQTSYNDDINGRISFSFSINGIEVGINEIKSLVRDNKLNSILNK